MAVAGYTLGGGLSFLSRKYGLAANNVRSIELVTADGRVVRCDREHEPDLFWALRGGGGSFGVVTEIELELFALAEVYAGVLWYPIERAADVLHVWRELTRSDPTEELTTLGRLLNLPPIPQIPEPVRGKSFVVVEVIHAGEAGSRRRAAGAAALTAPGQRHGSEHLDAGARTVAHGSGAPRVRRRRRPDARRPPGGGG